MDILFLILLSAMLLYRLLTVLGAKTGFEKQRPFLKPETDNIIIMPKRNVEEKEEDFVEKLPDYQMHRLSKIINYEPEFDGVEFIESAKMAYEMITKAFVEGDKKRLQKLLSKDVFDVFEKAIDQRLENKITQETEILDFLNVEIERSDVITINDDTPLAQITVAFKTKQVCVTYDEAGNIIDNPAKISVNQQDHWTFERPLNDDNPTWLLSKTKKLT